MTGPYLWVPNIRGQKELCIGDLESSRIRTGCSHWSSKMSNRAFQENYLAQDGFWSNINIKVNM